MTVAGIGVRFVTHGWLLKNRIARWKSGILPAPEGSEASGDPGLISLTLRFEKLNAAYLVRISISSPFVWMAVPAMVLPFAMTIVSADAPMLPESHAKTAATAKNE